MTPEELKTSLDELASLMKPWMKMEIRDGRVYFYLDHKNAHIGTIGTQWFVSFKNDT